MRRWGFGLATVAVLALAGVLALVFVGGYGPPTRAQATRRVKAFAQLVNYHYEQPEKIYAFMTPQYRRQISENDFAAAFKKERSYPYLTPFFINYESIEMDAENKSGTAFFSQAARLPGMIYELPFVYENGNYYMIVDKYAGFPDGSYLEKFDSIPHYLLYGWA